MRIYHRGMSRFNHPNNKPIHASWMHICILSLPPHAHPKGNKPSTFCDIIGFSLIAETLSKLPLAVGVTCSCGSLHNSKCGIGNEKERGRACVCRCVCVRVGAYVRELAISDLCVVLSLKSLLRGVAEMQTINENVNKKKKRHATADKKV